VRTQIQWRRVRDATKKVRRLSLGIETGRPARRGALPTEWDAWFRGPFDDLLALQARKFPNESIEMARAPELWVKKTKPLDALQ